MLVVYEKWAGDGNRPIFWPKVLLVTIAALLPHLSWVSQAWVNEGPSPLSGAGSYFASILSPIDSSHLGHQVILLSHDHLLPLFFRLFTQVHLLIDRSVEGQYITYRIQWHQVNLVDWQGLTPRSVWELGAD